MKYSKTFTVVFILTCIFLTFFLIMCTGYRFTGLGLITNYSEIIPDQNGDGEPEIIITPPVESVCTDFESDKKVMICHVPQGNLSNPIVIIIGINALEAHLDHLFDYFITCDDIFKEGEWCHGF